MNVNGRAHKQTKKSEKEFKKWKRYNNVSALWNTVNNEFPAKRRERYRNYY